MKKLVSIGLSVLGPVIGALVTAVLIKLGFVDQLAAVLITAAASAMSKFKHA
jgi:hypothetical protein